MDTAYTYQATSSRK